MAIISDRAVQIPFVAGRAVEGFTPVHLYPVQAALHLAFTPPHLPLPVNLGARMYTTAPSTESDARPFNVDTLFNPPARPSPVTELSRSSENVLGDHQNVLSALAHPVDLHHLGDSSLTSTLQSLGDGDTVLARMIAEAGVKWRLSPEAEWEKTIARLSSTPTTSAKAKGERTNVQSSKEIIASATKSESSVNEAVTGLEALLDKLKMDGDKVDMTSVKRKRKQKISKHKYKKRRKVSLFVSIQSCEGSGAPGLKDEPNPMVPTWRKGSLDPCHPVCTRLRASTIADFSS